MGWGGRFEGIARLVGNHRFRLAAVYGLAAIVLTGYAVARPPSLYDDEVGWHQVGQPTLAAYLRVFTDPSSIHDEIWSAPHANYGRCNPRVGVYVIGAVAEEGDDASGSRRTFVRMGLISAGTVALFFALMVRRGEPIAAALGVAFLLLNPVFREMAVQQRPDVPMLLFIVAGLVTAEGMRGASEDRRRYFLATLAAGTWLGLAVSTKLYALPLAPPVFAVAFWYGFRQRWWAAFAGVAVVAAAAAAIFYATNPLLWTDFVFGLRSMTTQHMDGSLLIPFGGLKSRDALSLLATLPLTMWRSIPIPPSLNALPRAIDWPFIGLGAALFAAGLTDAIRARRGVALLFLAGAFALQGWVVGTHPIGWTMPRVVLPPTFAVVWFEALGVACLAAWTRKAIATRRQRRASRGAAV